MTHAEQVKPSSTLKSPTVKGKGDDLLRNEGRSYQNSSPPEKEKTLTNNRIVAWNLVDRGRKDSEFRAGFCST